MIEKFKVESGSVSNTLNFYHIYKDLKIVCKLFILCFYCLLGIIVYKLHIYIIFLSKRVVVFLFLHIMLIWLVLLSIFNMFYSYSFLGSKISLKLSPSILNITTVINIARPGKIISHGAAVK